MEGVDFEEQAEEHSDVVLAFLPFCDDDFLVFLLHSVDRTERATALPDSVGRSELAWCATEILSSSTRGHLVAGYSNMLAEVEEEEVEIDGWLTESISIRSLPGACSNAWSDS